MTSVREGRVVRSVAIGDLKPGDVVQHYSTWEQTYGDAVRREVVALATHADPQKVNVVWRVPGEPPEPQYPTTEKRAAVVDLIVGMPERWVNAKVTILVPVDVPVDAGAHAKQEAVSEVIESLALPANAVARGEFEDCEGVPEALLDLPEIPSPNVAVPDDQDEAS